MALHSNPDVFSGVRCRLFFGTTLIAICSVIGGCDTQSKKDNESNLSPVDGAFHVYVGESIQDALNAAAKSSTKRVVVHEGVYSPDSPRQALVWLNTVHDGIILEAKGNVSLRGGSSEIADPESETFPAIVNHIVYFGDGITTKTVMRGFRIEGANGFVTEDESIPIQPETGVSRLEKSEFFYTDGGGIKIFGRSYPTIENVDVVGNYSRPCGGGVSVEHRGFNKEFAIFRDCVFRENRCQLTGSGVDVLPGSAAKFTNCLFLNNVGNTGKDDVSPAGRSYNAEHGSGALTVFPKSRVVVERCTFTGNWNGVDDKGNGNVYRANIFWKNTRAGGLSEGKRYEFDILSAINVEDCYLSGDVIDLRGAIDESTNTFNASDPEFDEGFFPHSPTYTEIGYRPTGSFILSPPYSTSATPSEISEKSETK